MNIVLIFADQMHKYALGRESGFVRTPNLDRLGMEGVTFRNCYSNNPVCTPYRGVLFTGLYSSRCHVTENVHGLPPDVCTMADAFNAAGYETSFVGKWHLGGEGNRIIPEDLRGGFRHFIGYQCYNGFYKDVHFYNEQNEERVFDEHRTDVTTRYAVERLKMLHQAGKPFLQVVGYQAPHYPEQPAPEFERLYQGMEIPVTPDFQDVEPYTPTFSPRSPRPFEDCPDYRRYGGNMQEYLRLYYGMVSQVDAGVGKILDCLDELGVREDTVVLFTSDHGDMQGSHGMVNKCTPYEKSCGTPLILSVPGGKTDRVCDTPVSGIDLYPTLLECAGLPMRSHLQGSSLAPVTFGGDLGGHPPVIAENYNHYLKLDGSGEGINWKMIRDERYKLTINADTGEPVLLFDMSDDPYELNNLVDEKTCSGLVNDLAGQIAARI